MKNDQTVTRPRQHDSRAQLHEHGPEHSLTSTERWRLLPFRHMPADVAAVVWLEK
jgi:hypothetical protein